MNSHQMNVVWNILRFAEQSDAIPATNFNVEKRNVEYGEVEVLKSVDYLIL